MNISPGDLVLVRYLDLDGGPTAAYQVIAVYDSRFYYLHLGKQRVYDIPVNILDDKRLEVTVINL